MAVLSLIRYWCFKRRWHNMALYTQEGISTILTDNDWLCCILFRYRMPHSQSLPVSILLIPSRLYGAYDLWTRTYEQTNIVQEHTYERNRTCSDLRLNCIELSKKSYEYPERWCHNVGKLSYCILHMKVS